MTERWHSRDGDAGGDDHPGRRDPGYRPPPRIRTTGEVPAVTADLPGPTVIDVPDFAPRPAGPGLDGGGPAVVDPGAVAGAEAAASPYGRAIDRPPATAPDWMSGVEVPEMAVRTGTWTPEELAPPSSRTGGVVQRGFGLALLAVLAVVVVLALVGSAIGLGLL